MRLIDADALDFEFDRRCFSEEDENYVRGVDEAIGVVENAPTIDPVHAAGACYCRECKYSKYDEKFSTYSCCKPMGCIASMLVRPTDFCSYGELKEDE